MTQSDRPIVATRWSAVVETMQPLLSMPQKAPRRCFPRHRSPAAGPAPASFPRRPTRRAPRARRRCRPVRGPRSRSKSPFIVGNSAARAASQPAVPTARLEPLERFGNRRLEPFECLQDRRRLPDEDAAVPIEPAGGEKFFGPRAIGLLAERGDAPAPPTCPVTSRQRLSPLDVAEAHARIRRPHAEKNQGLRARRVTIATARSTAWRKAPASGTK